MLFNSLHFIIFFSVVSCLFFASPRRWRGLLLLVASYWFYISWEPAYGALLLLATSTSYFVARSVHTAKNQRRKQLLFAAGCTFNLGLLFIFKYFNFFSQHLSPLFLQGETTPAPVLDLLLPIGISFYTFQTVGYLADVYRGEQLPEKRFGKYALFVSFFPQLVAGPIERSKDILPQLDLSRDFDFDRVLSGLRRIGWGFFKKVVIADRLSVIVDAVYSAPDEQKGPLLVFATLCFSFQIYCDFSGYCDIAIGAARILGIRLTENFAHPYFSESVSEFWRRWHITLMSWFRDYVYIPLGGNRVSLFHQVKNIAIVFTLSGLWHGANMTFVVWGALHALYLACSLVYNRARGGKPRKDVSQTFRLLRIVRTFLLVSFAWIFFRADTLDQAMTILQNLTSGWAVATSPAVFMELIMDAGLNKIATSITVCLTVTLLAIQLYRGTRDLADFVESQTGWIRIATDTFVIFGTILLGQFGHNEFIYFQF